ncbi:hypothetical protein ASC67_05290 [Methylibium sp. Root1272]|nr:hypothetical protein ASC67_05290 [Methylibium sp. Root1272]
MATIAGLSPALAQTPLQGGFARPLDAEARIVRHPERAAILAVASAGSRHVAVGERGLILLSDDDGRSWRQSKSPVSVTLTDVTFVGEQLGWAVGHSGIVLHTADGGQSWIKQADGAQLARLALEEADRLIAGGSPAGAAVKRSSQGLVDDGPDKPLLGVSFGSATVGVVVGAYGLAFMTRDGGKTWQSLLGLIDNPTGQHLNAVAVNGRTTLIAGEQGLVLKSNDGLGTFERLPSPYRGSLFAAALLPSGHAVVGGIKGNLFVSETTDSPWKKVDLAVPSAVTAISGATNGVALVATQAGVVYRLLPDQGIVETVPSVRRPMMTAVSMTANGSFIIGSLYGLVRSASGEPQNNKP